jgi:hypothetical protein
MMPFLTVFPFEITSCDTIFPVARLLTGVHDGEYVQMIRTDAINHEKRECLSFDPSAFAIVAAV